MASPPGPPICSLPLLHGVQPSRFRKMVLVVDQIAAAWMAAEPYGPPTIVHLLLFSAGYLAGHLKVVSSFDVMLLMTRSFLSRSMKFAFLVRRISASFSFS